MDHWDVIFIVVAGYIAVVTLVRLMTKRRDELIEEVREQLEQRNHRRAPSTEPGDADPSEAAS